MAERSPGGGDRRALDLVVDNLVRIELPQ
jgi:hypothetical protein